MHKLKLGLTKQEKDHCALQQCYLDTITHMELYGHGLYQNIQNCIVRADI